MSNNVLTVTDKAIKQIKNLLASEAQEGKEIGLRINVEKGGCSGLSYKMEFGEKASNEVKYDYGDLSVFMTPVSSTYFFGVTLDFKDGLNERGFVFENPNAKKTCSCGDSFAV